MNAKEEGIVFVLKEISKMENEMAEDAMKKKQHSAAIRAMTIAKVTADAAEIIKMQAKELETLKAQSAPTHSTTPNIGRHVRLKVMADNGAHIIVGESKSHFLITSISVNPIVKVCKSEVVFVNQ